MANGSQLPPGGSWLSWATADSLHAKNWSSADRAIRNYVSPSRENLKGGCFLVSSQVTFVMAIKEAAMQFKEICKKWDYMEVSWNGTPKSSILIGTSIVNQPFWGTPILWNTQYCVFFWAQFLGIAKLSRPIEVRDKEETPKVGVEISRLELWNG